MRACQPAEDLSKDILRYLVLNLDLWHSAPVDTQRHLLKLLHKLGQVSYLFSDPSGFAETCSFHHCLPSCAFLHRLDSAFLTLMLFAESLCPGGMTLKASDLTFCRCCSSAACCYSW